MTQLRARPIDPLDSRVPIVDPSGRPLPTFIRQWLAARNVNLTVGDVTVSLEELQANLQEAREAATQLQAYVGQVAESLGDAIDALGAPTGVVAGTYGSETKVPRLTVNARGQLTVVEEVTLAGGGGGGGGSAVNLWARYYTNVESGSNPGATGRTDKMAGVRFSARSTAAVAGVEAWLLWANGESYEVALWDSAGSTKLATAVITGDGTNSRKTGLFAAPVTLTPGVLYYATFECLSGQFRKPTSAMRLPLCTTVSSLSIQDRLRQQAHPARISTITQALPHTA